LTTDTKNWRVLYKVAVSEENSNKIIEEKFKIYDRCYLSGFKLFLDRYSDTESFIDSFRDKLRGICSKHQYNSKEDKDFKK
jgi:hypothetical protein